ncbi:MAG: chemotaxis protein CheD [Bacteroidota bacterium]|nr:chemotaxis protein CheD [Bacteroidota bacterium]
MEVYYLKTSELYVSRKSCKITTVLGSCVAVCLWDKELRYGGMNHFLLPQYNVNSSYAPSPKFGDYAINDLILKMNNLGSKTSNIRAKVFGGAKIFNIGLNIGEKNIGMAFDVLKKRKIPIIQQDTGGLIPRKIIFYNIENKIELIKIKKTI